MLDGLPVGQGQRMGCEGSSSKGRDVSCPRRGGAGFLWPGPAECRPSGGLPAQPSGARGSSGLRPPCDVSVPTARSSLYHLGQVFPLALALGRRPCPPGMGICGRRQTLPVSWRGRRKSPQTGGLQTTDLSSLPVPGARSLRPRCGLRWLLLEAVGESIPGLPGSRHSSACTPATLFSASSGERCFPISVSASSQDSPLPACALLPAEGHRSRRGVHPADLCLA